MHILVHIYMAFLIFFYFFIVFIRFRDDIFPGDDADFELKGSQRLEVVGVSTTSFRFSNMYDRYQTPMSSNKPRRPRPTA
jgi:hypothetical protein